MRIAILGTRGIPANYGGFETFAEQNASWLEDYALFCALKDSHGGVAWHGWESELMRREAPAIAKAQRERPNF